MLVVEGVQGSLTILQAIPIVGSVAAVAKGVFSFAQVVSGLAIGVFCGISSGACRLVGLETMGKLAGRVARQGFNETVSGMGHLFSACVNLVIAAALGVALGLAFRQVTMISL